MEQFVHAGMAPLGECEISQAEPHRGDKTWDAEGAIERQAFLEEAPRRRMVVLDIGRDHPEVCAAPCGGRCP